MIDKKLSDILHHEQERQAYEIEMIASENYVSNDVLEAYSNVFTNKYSEGNPGARYYGGNQFVDDLERLTQHRALRMFGLLQAADEDNIISDLDGATR
jgi:glycine hydroxymethyltransferase